LGARSFTFSGALQFENGAERRPNFVSSREFPANREKNREFRHFDASRANPKAEIDRDPAGFDDQFPKLPNREFSLPSKVKIGVTTLSALAGRQSRWNAAQHWALDQRPGW